MLQNKYVKDCYHVILWKHGMGSFRNKFFDNLIFKTFNSFICEIKIVRLH